MRSTYLNSIVGALLAVTIGVSMAPSTANADGVHKASQAEIEAYVAKKADLTKLSNGWSYKSNAKYGYKFADGSMCVRTQSGSVSCTTIVTDGKKFYMVSPNGTRTAFSGEG
jgi:hypothetical protein